MKERIAIIDGVRTPFCKAGGKFRDWLPDDLGAFAVKEILARTGFPAASLDEVIMGNCMQPPQSANVARVTSQKACIPDHVTAYTVHRNCASGMEAVTTATNKILAGEAEVILTVAAESMSQTPLLYGRKMTDLFSGLMRAKTIGQRLKLISTFRPGFLTPIIGLQEGLTDPICNLIMGMTAEILARDFHIDRPEQDAFALESHKRATMATTSGRLGDEILPTPVAPKWDAMQMADDGPRSNQTIEALTKLRPFFDKVTGTVTAGNASQVTDGGAAALIMRESHAKAMGYKPMGYLREYSYAALEGCRMGLGPVYATAKLLKKTGMELKDFQLFEINEAFAVQVQACLKAMASDTYCQEHLGRSAIGEIPMDLLNVNGGAIALGHPVGCTGLRLVITLLKEMRRRNVSTGLASLCVGGGQGAALALEIEE